DERIELLATRVGELTLHDEHPREVALTELERALRGAKPVFDRRDGVRFEDAQSVQGRLIASSCHAHLSVDANGESLAFSLEALRPRLRDRNRSLVPLEDGQRQADAEQKDVVPFLALVRS